MTGNAVCSRVPRGTSSRPSRMEVRRTDEVDDIGVLGTRYANEEIVGLNVAVDEGLVMYGLYAGNLEYDRINMVDIHGGEK